MAGRCAVCMSVAMLLGATGASACDGVRLNLDGHAIVEVRIDGRPARLALDPIRSVLLDRGYARSEGFALLDGTAAGQGGTVRAGGAGAAEQEVLFARDMMFELPGHRQTLPLVPTVDLRGPMGADFDHIDGLLGTDLFADKVLRLDFPAVCMTVLAGADYHPPAGATRVPIRRLRDKPTIAGAITLPDGTQLPTQFLLDFGMSGGVRLSTRFVDRHALHTRLETRKPPRMETGLGGTLDSLHARIPAAQIGPDTRTDIVVSLAREPVGADASPPWDALVGMDIMRNWHIDYDVSGDSLLFH